MKITIQFDHLILFATVGKTVRVLLPSGGHGAEASLARAGTITTKALPSELSLKFTLSTGVEASMGAPTVDSFRLPDLNKVITPAAGQSLVLDEKNLNCVVVLRGGGIKGADPTFDNSDDEQYKNDDWDFGGGVTSKLTNHVEYFIDTANSADLIDGAGAVWHTFADGDRITISNMDSSISPTTTISGSDIELAEFADLYALIGNKASTPANPKTAFRGAPPSSIMNKILEFFGIIKSPQHAPAGGTPTPDKPICASAKITVP